MSKTSHDLRNLSGGFDSFNEDSLRAIDSGEGSVPISGYAARFNEISEDLGGFREIISPGAFDDVLKDPATDVRALINHEGVPLARYKGGRSENTLELTVDDEGLRYNFDLNLAQPEARALASAMRRGDIDQSCSDSRRKTVLSLASNLKGSLETCSAFRLCVTFRS